MRVRLLRRAHMVDWWVSVPGPPFPRRRRDVQRSLALLLGAVSVRREGILWTQCRLTGRRGFSRWPAEAAIIRRLLNVRRTAGMAGKAATRQRPSCLRFGIMQAVQLDYPDVSVHFGGHRKRVVRLRCMPSVTDVVRSYVISSSTQRPDTEPSCTASYAAFRWHDTPTEGRCRTHLLWRTAPERRMQPRASAPARQDVLDQLAATDHA